MTRTPAGSKCRLLCVATVWPLTSAVAAMSEFSQIIVRFLAFSSESNEGQLVAVGGGHWVRTTGKLLEQCFAGDTTAPGQFGCQDDAPTTKPRVAFVRS